MLFRTLDESVTRTNIVTNASTFLFRLSWNYTNQNNESNRDSERKIEKRKIKEVRPTQHCPLMKTSEAPDVSNEDHADE